MSRTTIKLVLLALCVFLGSAALGQDPSGPPNPSGWNGSTPSPTPQGFVAADTFYWVIGVGTTIVGTLSSVIGVLWFKLGKKEEDERRDVLLQITLVAGAVTRLVDDWSDEKKSLRELLKSKDERLEKQHEKTLKIAVRAQQAVEAMANLPIGGNILDGEDIK